MRSHNMSFSHSVVCMSIPGWVDFVLLICFYCAIPPIPSVLLISVDNLDIFQWLEEGRLLSRCMQPSFLIEIKRV